MKNNVMGKRGKRFLALLLAAAMVLPSSLSGMGRVYAEDGDMPAGDPTPTEVKATDEELHQLVTNDDFFSSRLALDSSLLEDGFEVEVRDRDTGAELNGYRLAYFDKSVPRSTDSGNDQMKFHADQWFGNDTHIGGSFPTTIEAHPKRYNRFYSDKTGEIPAYSLVFRDEATAEKAAVHVHYPQIGTYDGKPIGMNVVINNIDAQKRNEFQRDEYRGTGAGNNMWYPAFQIGAKPEGGIIQENIHTADYYVTFFYADTESNQDEGIVGKQIEKTGDIYLTLSSLSMGFQDLGGNDGQYWGPEKVKPITDVTEGFITDKSDIFTSFENSTSYSSSKDEYYDVPAIIAGNEAGTTQDRGAFTFSSSGDDGYYAPFTGEWVVKRYTDTEGKAAEAWHMQNDPKTTTGNWGGWFTNNYYRDDIGHPTFTKNAVSMLYSDSDAIGFRTNTTNNSMWFTIYPQGLTNMTPKNPAVSSDDEPSKSVYPNLENTEIPSSTGYRAGETIKYLVTQQANELSYNSIVRYNSFSISDTVPEGTTLLDSGRRVYYIAEKAKLDADGAAVVDENGNPIMEPTEIDVTDKGSFSVDGNKLTFTFNEAYLHNDMPMRGETYYMTLEAKVNSGLAEGTELVNTVDTNINGKSFPDRTKTENANVGKTTAKVITHEVKYEERLTDRNQEFVFVISQAVPADATSIEITDEIDELLQVVGTPRLVYIGDEDGDGETEEIDVAGAKIMIDPPSSSLQGDDKVHQIVTASVMDGVAANQKYVTDIRGKMLALKIVAKIRKDVTDEQLLAKELNRIPNKADVKFNNKSKTTNEVDVVPPYKAEKSVFNKNKDGKNYNAKGIESDEFISKGEDKTIHSDAVTPGDVFTYRITYPVPSDAESLRFIDYLDKAVDADPDGTDPEGSGGANGVLLLYAEDTANAIRVYGDDTKTPIKTFALPSPQVDLPGGKGYKNVIFTLPKGDLDKIKGQVMTIEFDVMIDPTKSAEDIDEVYGRVSETTGYVHEGINNTAGFKFNNNPWLYTNTVTITTNPEKQVEGDNQKQLDASAYEIANREDPFTYTVTDTIPLNADRVIMSDTLEEVLEFYSNGARVSEGGKWRANKSIETAARVKAVVDKNGTPTDVELVYNKDFKTVIGKSPEGINTITVTLTPAGLLKIKPAVGSEGTPGEVIQTVVPNDPENYHKIETLLGLLPEGVTVNARAARGPQTIFVETSDGKYWQSTNEGATWKECTAAHEIAFAQHRIADDGTYANNTVLDMGATITEETVGGTDPSDNIETKITFEFDAIIKRAPDKTIDEVDTATAEQLQKYILANDGDQKLGIPNTATLDFNGTPRVTNEVNVVPQKLGDLTISKSVSPRSGAFTDEELNAEFTFVITLTAEETKGDPETRTNLSGTFDLELSTIEGMESQLDNITLTDAISKDGENYKITFTDGQAEINMKHGVIATVKGLPADAIVQYVIEENPSTNFRQQGASSDSGTIQNGVPVEADFTNIKADGPKKNVSREDGSNFGNHIGIAMEEVFRYTLQDNIVSNAKEVKVIDELEDVLALVIDDEHAIKAYYVENGEEVPVGFEVTKGANGEKDLEITIADNANGLSQAAGRTLTVEFYARIAEGTTAEQLRDYYVTPSDDLDVQSAREKNYIPNKATFDVDGTARVTNQVTVKPPTDKPEKEISADGEAFDIEKLKLTNREDVFYYQISQLVPAVITEDGSDKEVEAVVFTDHLETVLKFAGDVVITADDENLEAVAEGDIEVTQNGQDLEVIIKGETLKAVHNKIVKVTFPAQIKEGVTDAELLRNYGGTTDIPNEATVKINNTPGTTEKVYVTPPPAPEKRVENDVHVSLEDREKTFTYEVKQFIPADAETVEFVDKLNAVLDFVGTYTVKAQATDGTTTTIKEDVFIGANQNASEKAEELKFTLTGDDLEAAKGSTLVVTFQAKFDPDKSDSEIIAAYEGAVTNNDPVVTGYTSHDGVRNQATIKIGPDNSADTNIVTVTIPSTEPGDLDVTKQVLPAEEELSEEDKDASFKFTVEFTFDEHADVPDSVKVAIIETGADTESLGEGDYKEYAIEGGKIELELKHGQTAHIIDIPGKTTYKVSEQTKEGYVLQNKFGDSGKIDASTTPEANFVNQATAPPHPGSLSVQKAVSGEIPAGYENTEFEFTVALSDHGPVADDVVIKLNDKELTEANSKKDENGKVTEITFKVKINDKAVITGIPAGTKFTVTEKEDVAFKLSTFVNAEGTISSDHEVTGVAINKFEQPDADPEKRVNGREHDDLSAKDQAFTYTVTQFVPVGTKIVTFEDVLNGELVYDGIAVVTGGELNKNVEPDGQKLSFELTEEEIAQVEGRVMTVTFNAKYKEDATDETIEGSYVDVNAAGEEISDATEEVAHSGTPNQAKTKVGNHEANTNVVTVTAPPDVPAPEKKVEGDKYGTEDKPALKLNGRDKVFTYSVTQEIPASLNLKSISFTDTIKDVLEFNEASKKANAKIVDETGAEVQANVTIEGQKITATPEALEGLAGKTLTFSFEAKIKSSVTDEQLIAAYGASREIPNEATVNVNGSPIGTNEVKVVPPSEEEQPEKTVQADHDAEATKALSTLNARNEEFTYTVNQKVPAGANYIAFEDTIEDVLDFVGENGGAKLTYTDAEGNEATLDAVVTVEGKTLTAVVDQTNAESNSLEPTFAKVVSLTFKAKLADGITDKQLFDKYGSFEIPNEATVKFNPEDQGLTTNKVFVTPPPEEPEEPEKFVEGVKAGTDEAATEAPLKLVKRPDVFTYTVTQKVPAKATRMQFIDNLQHVLKVANSDDVKLLDASGAEITEASIQIVGNLVMATLDDEAKLEELFDQTLTLQITAKLRDNVTDEELIDEYGANREIPNEATIIIGNDSKTTNEVKVTPPEEPEEPQKYVNGKQTLETVEREKEFTYTVTQRVPDNADTVSFEDVIEPALEVVSVSIDGKADYEQQIDDQYVEADEPDVTYTKVTVGTQDATVDRGEMVTLTIVAKIKADWTDEMLIERYGSTVVPNYATVTIDDEPLVTNTVEVTPPPVPSDEPEKKVEGENHFDLPAAEGEEPTGDDIKAAREKVFNYTVSQKVPSGAVTLAFEDTLESVLELAPTDGNATLIAVDEAGTEETITIDGTKVVCKATAEEGINKITLTIDDEETVKGLVGKTVTFAFDAKIKANVTDAELIAKYRSTDVPNTARVLINGNPKSSNTVTVTPPPSEGKDPEKGVEGRTAAGEVIPALEGKLELEKRTDIFTYTVKQEVMDEAVKVTFTDTVEPVLEIVGEPTLVDETGAMVAADIQVSANKRTLTAVVDDDPEEGTPGEEGYKPAKSQAAGKTLTLKFQAKIKAGVSDAELIRAYGETKEIPNVATVSMNDNPKVTNEVTVTPPPTEREEPKKEVTPDGEGTVDGEKVEAKLMNRKETFTYTISQVVPNGAVELGFDDVLERVLEVQSATLAANGEDITNAEGVNVSVRNGRIVSATVRGNDAEGTPYATAYAEQTMVLTIVAKIRDGVTDEQLIALYGDERKIPNEATVTIDGDGKTTNEVTVTPPGEPEDPEKEINGQKEIVNLSARDEEFTYTVKQLIPENAKTVTITDTIENELVFVDGTASFSEEGIEPSISDKTITVQIDDATAMRGKEVVLTFKAMIDPEVTDQQLLDRAKSEKYEKDYSDTTTIPNKAEVKFDFEDDPRSTNTVEVTPPPVPSEEPEKKVNGADALKLEQAEGQELAEARAQVFTYTVSQKVPAGAVKLEFEDTLEDVLEIVGTPTLSTGAEATVEGQKVTAVVTDKEVLKEGEVVTLTIEAKIRAEVKDSDLIAKYGTTTIPNKAKVAINGNPKSTNEVKVTPPDEPGDKPEKKVNGEEQYALSNRVEQFTYTVTQKLPSEVTKVEFSDKLESVLVIDKASAEIIGSEDAAAYVIEVNGQTITAKAEDASKDAGKEITLSFKANLKLGTTDAQLIALYGEKMEIPNTAIVTIDDTPKVTNEVTVTPPPSKREDPKKGVEGMDEDGNVIPAVEGKLTLEKRPDEFTYTVEQVIPAGAVEVEFTDILKDVLTVVGTPTVTVDGEAVTSAQVDVINGQAVSAKVADATAYADKTMVLTIKAKIKDDISDATLIALYGEAKEIPNEATVRIDGSGKGTNKVLVTPPEEPEEPTKKINGSEQRLELTGRDEEFTYTVEQLIPSNAKTVTITDTIEKELIFKDAGTFSEAGGTISISGKTITVQVDDATAMRGKTVTLTFKAAIDPNVTDAMLLAREGAYNKTTVIPNKAEVKFNFSDEPLTTNTVEVTPPPTPSEEPEKKVGTTADSQSADLLTLEERNQTFVYTVSQKIPAGAVNVVFEDTLEDVLEVVGEPTLTRTSGETVGAAVVDGQKVTATIEDATAYADDTITLTINAKIRDEVKDKDLIAKYASTVIPNKANVKINGNGKSTNEVKVTPPDSPGEKPVKEVNGAEHVDLKAKYEEFTYTVTQKLPADAEKVEFSDTVESILEITGEPSVTGKATYQITVSADGRTVTATSDDAAADANEDVTLTFTAKIRKSATEDQIAAYADRKIPNKATVTVNDNPKLTNEVTVTPPTPTEEEPEKKVNDAEAYNLTERDEVFTYTVSQKIPDGAVNVVFEDTLERVLEIQETNFSVTGITPIVDGQTVTATIEDATELSGQTVVLTIKAMIREDVSDDELIKFYGDAKAVPNKARVTIDGKGKVTNEVTVTPPDVPTEEPVKKVGKNADSQSTDELKLENRGDEYVYTVSQVIPKNAVNVVFEDKLEDVLDIVSCTIDADGVTPVVNGQTVTATIADARALAGQTVTLTITAKLNENVPDALLISRYGETKQIPNKATVTIDGKGKTTNEVLVTPPDEPTPEPPTPEDPVKKVNGTTNPVELATRPEKFTYTVEQLIPENAVDVVFTDTLEDVLVIDKAEINASGEGVECKIEGQTVTATIKDATALAGQTIVLTIEAHLNEEVTDEQLIAKYGNTKLIPNTADVSIDGNGRSTNKVFVTPPPEEPEIPEEPTKTVSKEVLDTRDEEFTYTVSQKIPKGAVNVVFTDTLERVLEVKETAFSVDGITPVVSGQTVTATIADAKALAGQTVTLTIKAVIRSDVSDAELISLYGEARNIPNKATVTIDGSGKTTNEVLVTPPEEPKDLKSLVTAVGKNALANLPAGQSGLRELTADDVLGTKPSEAAKTVEDDVIYENLVPGKTYTVISELVMIEDGAQKVVASNTSEQVADADGDGTWKVTMTLSGPSTDETYFKPNATYVVFETVMDGEALVIEHKDASDKDQSFTITESEVPYNPFGDQDIVAEKIWDDNNNARKMRKDITLELYRKIGDGEWTLVEGKTIKADATGDDLMVTWQKMPTVTEDGQLISYEVREAKVDGYKAASIVVTGDAISGFKFTVTNTIEPEEPPKENPPKENPPTTPPTTPPKTPSRNVEKAKKVQSTTPSAPPKTGDTADLYIWSILMLAAAMATIVAMRRRKEQD